MIKHLLVVIYLSSGGVVKPLAVYPSHADCQTAAQAVTPTLTGSLRTACVPVPDDMEQARHGGAL